MNTSAIARFWQDLRADARTYEHLGGFQTCQGFWVGATYRLGKLSQRLPYPVGRALRVPYKVLDNLWRTILNVRISPQAEIGPGLCLIHPWNVLIGPSRIGENCLIFHEVTLGTNANSRNAFPCIGDGVDIYVGARVLGQVTIEDGVTIGANCVVLNNVPKGATVAPPAVRIIPAAVVAAFGARSQQTRDGG
jgi:serine O-acetyltransferase